MEVLTVSKVCNYSNLLSTIEKLANNNEKCFYIIAGKILIMYQV